MKKIAMIMDGWKQFTTYAWPSGVITKIKEQEREANLYIFHSFGNWSKDQKYNSGEYNIFRLPDLRKFDGIILDLTNIQQAEVQEYVIEKAKEAGCPVMMINQRIEGFHSVGINNRLSIKKIMAHLTEVHHASSFWFIMGPRDNFENQSRYFGIREFLEEHRLSENPEDFYYQNYEAGTGIDGFASLYESHGEKLPDAIVCANDNIAVGVLIALRKRGIKCPEEILVTGFDDFDKARYFQPSLTTVRYIREDVGYKCAELLLDYWAGKEIPVDNYIDSELICRESCGCDSEDKGNPYENLANQIINNLESTAFEESVLSMEYEMMRCSNVEEVFRCIPRYIPAFQCDALYLVSDYRMRHYYIHHEEYENGIFDDTLLTKKGYPKEMCMEFAYEQGMQKDYAGNKVEDILSCFEAQESGEDYLFLPVHIENLVLGYFVIKNAVYILEKQYLFRVMTALTKTLESFYYNEKLTRMNDALSKYYVEDYLTKLYNRYGYQKLAKKIFNREKAVNGNLAVIFMDLDQLKMINDKYGHDCGDKSILSVAEAFRLNSGISDVPVRVGGDEFLLIVSGKTEEEVEALIQKIERDVARIGCMKHLPLPISVSAGYCFADWKEGKTLEEYVLDADAAMYKHKRSKKEKDKREREKGDK